MFEFTESLACGLNGDLDSGQESGLDDGLEGCQGSGLDGAWMVHGWSFGQ